MLQGKTVYKNKILRVFERKVDLPNGTSFERAFVETGNKVVIIPITLEGKLMLGNFFSPITNSQALRFPRGSINPKEQVENAAKRELLEETGYEPQQITVLKPFYYPNPAWHTEHWQIAIAKDLVEKPITKDKFEDLGTVYLSVKQLEEKILSGEIFDASTITAFYLFKNAN